ncbi:sodium-dependent neutral amino acid transporter SLC6A17-like [Episyrphus balteatus]|uniref:sodium-dependent neutral amino acid transporter SLC6A17-like n=1 Tax=Episyrphus balteatus TaxID=286459 RepID=UPI00248645D4|nr:sodium-dependent neutral amino acid transporter SLC6A17-like [Episyrphus balteatus]
MVYETSYDTGLKPFNHDKNRGKWASPDDFFFACLGHAFKIDAVFILPSVLFFDLGIYTLIPYFITLGACVVPIVFMQSFLGQFSSTGFISVFRVSPIFKGIGYVSLVINLISLTYYAVLGAIPLFFFLHTLKPTIPWSCEGAKSWMDIKANSSSICTYNNETYGNYTELEVPSVEYFDKELNTMGLYHRTHPEGKFSWFLMICSFLIWGMVAIVALKPIEIIGKFLRYSCLTVLGIMGLCLLRLLFLPGALDGLKDVFNPSFFMPESIMMVPFLAFSALGPGWGSVLTMASYNKFDTNIFRYSWLLCLAQVGMMMGVGFLSLLVMNYIARMDPDNIGLKYIHSQWMEFLTIPTALTYMELPHIWSLLFFGMLILGSLNLLITQLISILTSVFDEFELLRGLKKEVTLGTMGFMALTSIFYCSNYGITIFETLAQISILTQMILNLLLLIVIVWIYGRERFQRDVSFMTDQTYSTWMVNIVRYVAPLFIFIAWLAALAFVLIHLQKLDSRAIIFLLAVIAAFPLLLIPGYSLFRIYQTTGLVGMRMRRCARPTDWYPVDPSDRQRYEERFNEGEISHNLFTETDE